MRITDNFGFSGLLPKVTRKGKRFFSVLFFLASIIMSAHVAASAATTPPGVPDLTHDSTYLKIIDDYAVADNTANDRIRAHIVDSDGNPVAGVNVNFRWNPGTGEVTIGITTDVNGNAFLQLASAIVGKIAVNARVGGVLLINSNPIEVTYVAFAPSVTAPTTRLEVVMTGSIADGTALNIVRAIITDAAGNPVPNKSVTFFIATGVANFTTPVTVITNANGEAFVSLSSTTVGSVGITADVAGVQIINGSPATVTFVYPPDVSQPSTLLEVIKTGSLADGTAANSVRAHITDQFGNPVAGQIVTFTIATGTATPGPLTAITDASGNAVLTLTSTTIGTVTITATVNGVNIPNGSPASVVFVVDVPNTTVATTRLVVTKGVAVADGVEVNTVTAIITDKNGNLLAGQTVSFTVTPGTAIFVGAPTFVTNAAGEAVINILSTVSGFFDITATVNGTDITNGSPATIQFLAGAPDVSNPLTALTVTKDSAAADGTDLDIVKAHIVDAFGNPVPGQTVTFAIASGSATPSGSLTFTTDANGDAILTLTSTANGNATITAVLNTISVITFGSPAAITFITYADVSEPETFIVVMTDNAAADETAVNTVRAHVVDNNGNPMANQRIVFTITSGEATIKETQPILTDANGDAVISLVSKKVGYVTLTATVEGKNIINGSPAKVRFTADDVWVPRVFTPNGDGTNDIIRPIINGSFQFKFFSIYNRWGNQLFNSVDVNAGWDGKLKGVLQPNETYLWIIGGTDRNNVRAQKRGMFTLVR